MTDLITDVVQKADYHIIFFSNGREVVIRQIASLLQHYNKQFTWVSRESALYESLNRLQYGSHICIWNRSGKILDSIASYNLQSSVRINFVEIILNGFNEIQSTSSQYAKHYALLKEKGSDVNFLGFDDIPAALVSQLSSTIYGFIYTKICLPFLPLARDYDLDARSAKNIKLMAEIGNLFSNSVHKLLKSFDSRKLPNYFSSRFSNVLDVLNLELPLDEIYDQSSRISFLNGDYNLDTLITIDKDFIGLFKDIQRYRVAKKLSKLGRNFELIGTDFKVLGLEASESIYRKEQVFRNCFQLDLGSHSLISRFYQRPVEAIYYGGIPIPLFLYTSEGEEISHPYNEIVIHTYSSSFSYLELLKKNPKPDQILGHLDNIFTQTINECIIGNFGN